MATKKKLIREDDIDTKAGQTLHPAGGNASHAGDPKSRFEHIASMIGATHAMRDFELEKWWKEAAELIGKEARNIPDGVSTKNSSSIDMNPSDAPTSKVSKTSYSEAMPSLKEAMKADLDKIFETQEGLSDEFKTQAAVLFETAVMALVRLKEEEMRAQLNEEAEEALAGLMEELSEEVEDYLNEIAIKWFAENEVAIESSLRNELAEDFIAGLKNLFMEHFIDIPDDRVDIVNSLAEKVEELEAQLAETMEENFELRSVVEQAAKEDIVEAAIEGLTMVEAEKLVELAEAIDTDDIEEFAEKVALISESNFVKGDTKKKPAQKTTPSTITEQMEEIDEEGQDDKKPASPEMAPYLAALNRTTKR